MLINIKVNKFVSISISALMLVGICILGSCKKRTAFNEENAQESIDSGTFRAEGDAALEDVNNVISNQFLLRGKGLSENESAEAMANTPCGIDLDTTQILNTGIARLVYNGTTCNNKLRSGVIVISIIDYPLKKWKQKGCSLKVEFQNYKVTGVNDGRTIKVNGTCYLVNESGSTWYDMRFLNASTVIHSISGNNIKLNFDESTDNVIINISRRYTYTIASNVISCTVEGTGVSSSKTNLESWGISRSGNNFTSQITTPIIWKTSCGANSPVQGEVKVNVDEKYFELTSTFGVDASGNAISGTGCAYGWKTNWTYKKKTNKRIFAYSR